MTQLLQKSYKLINKPSDRFVACDNRNSAIDGHKILEIKTLSLLFIQIILTNKFSYLKYVVPMDGDCLFVLPG